MFSKPSHYSLTPPSSSPASFSSFQSWGSERWTPPVCSQLVCIFDYVFVGSPCLSVHLIYASFNTFPAGDTLEGKGAQRLLLDVSEADTMSFLRLHHVSVRPQLVTRQLRQARTILLGQKELSQSLVVSSIPRDVRNSGSTLHVGVWRWAPVVWTGAELPSVDPHMMAQGLHCPEF